MTADAIVVGGGPAGSTVAWRLARGGRRVLVLDAARFPRVKLCAGWVTHAVLRDLEIEAATYPHTMQPFASVAVGVDGRRHDTRWDHVASFGIVRAEFDAWLLRRAEAAGATVREGARVRRVERAGDAVVVHTDAEAFTAPLVVGAGGHHCPVARALDAVADDEEVVVTQESETRVGAERLRTLTACYGSPELYAEPDFHGYAWYFTKGDFLNVGIGAQGGLPIGRRLARFLEALRAAGQLPGDLPLTPFRGHAYTVRRDRPRRLAGPGYVLVGDSAGLARDLSGEGIGPAVRSACLAAETILNGDPGSYPARLVAALGRPSAFANAVARHAPGRVIEMLARLACTVPWTRRRFVLEGAFGIG